MLLRIYYQSLALHHWQQLGPGQTQQNRQQHVTGSTRQPKTASYAALYTTTLSQPMCEPRAHPMQSTCMHSTSMQDFTLKQPQQFSCLSASQMGVVIAANAATNLLSKLSTTSLAVRSTHTRTHTVNFTPNTPHTNTAHALSTQ